MDKQTPKGKILEEQLGRKRKCAWEAVEGQATETVFQFAEDYKEFLDRAKTERETVREIICLARENGFLPFEEYRAGQQPLMPGTKLIVEQREKAVALVVIGTEPITQGFRLVGSHLDSPRLDLKPEPLYEDEGLALFKTHYYGGIKKYQWTSLPLALHGVVYKRDGSKCEIVIGENPTDPVFLISDLLPHLAKDQMQKKMSEGIEGETLNLVVGNIPVTDDDVKEKVKLAILATLHRNYGLVEEDFISAELEAVPAGKPRDVGFDRGLIAAYGQDDRICVFASLKAILELGQPRQTAIALFMDKEEIGSVGKSGMQSRFFENLIAELVYSTIQSDQSIWVRRALSSSQAISADVNAGLDPNFEGVYDKRNAARIGYGVVLTKYTGSGGKANSNEADAAYVNEIRRLFNRHGVVWQTGELGKIDQGGGGTIAAFIGNYGLDVIDCGPALLGMHAPWELASKIDLYMTYRAYASFWTPDK
ncbi:MAG: aminopeptidase [Firmicutes bacterium]|nr:aminopeptidase [Bacillota bacterium]